MQWTQNPPEFGDMVRVKMSFYYHYGIYKDPETVIQFGRRNNGNTPPDEIAVLITGIDEFSEGEFVETSKLDFSEKRKRRSPEKTVELALSRVGEKGYNILNNNCEHFAYDCMFGEKRSFLDDVRSDIRKKLNLK